MPLDQSGTTYVPARNWQVDADGKVAFSPEKWNEQDQATYDDLNAVRAELLLATQTVLDDIRGGIPQAEYDTLTEIANELALDNTAFAHFINQLALKAPIASPALTGTPTAPTPAQTSNDTTIATTSYVQDLVTAVTQGSITNAAVLVALGFTPAIDSHLHDGRYYTRSEVDTQQAAQDSAINGKTDTGHAHTIASVTGLQDALNDASGDVDSFNTRTGPVTSADDDYTSAQILHSGSTVGGDRKSVADEIASLKAVAISVKAFGAIGDGTTDDTAAIQSALDATHTAGGGNVYLPAATYRLDSSLRMRPTVSIYGDGIKETTLDSRAATKGLYADEAIAYVDYAKFGITHTNNVNITVDMMVFEKGISRSGFDLSLVGKSGGVTRHGIINYGVDQATTLANNNQYGCLFKLITNAESSAVEISGIALWLQSDDTVNSRQNAHTIDASVIDGFSTGIKLNGNGNSIRNVTLNGPASVAGLHLHGDGCHGNTIIGPYFDSGITGDPIKLEAGAARQHMAIIIGGVKNLTASDVVDASTGGNSGNVTIMSRSRINLAPGLSSSVTDKSSSSGSTMTVGSSADLGNVGIPSATGGGLIVSGESYAGGLTSVSNSGGASVSINDNASAEFRVVKTGNGSSYTKIFSVDYSGNMDAAGDASITGDATASRFQATGPIKCGSYTVGTAPGPGFQGAGSIIYVTNELGGATHAFSDGTNWRRVSDLAIIS